MFIFVYNKKQNEMKITRNKSARTYTVTSNGSKYRTDKLSKEQFDDSAFNTPDDWKNEIRQGNLNQVK